MVDRERLSFCNMGIVNIKDLDRKSEGTPAAFSIATIRDNNPNWGHAKARPTVKYPISRHIEFAKLTDLLAPFSIKKDRSTRLNKSLRDTITDYVLSLESGKHLFCIHPRAHSEFYYVSTIVNTPRKLIRMNKIQFPEIIIITKSTEDSNRICGKLVRERHDQACGIMNLDSRSVTEESRMKHSDKDRIMIGTAEKLNKYIEEVTQSRRIEDLAMSVKFVIINSAEKVESSPVTKYLIQYLSDKCNLSWTRFIFMYNFVNAPRSLLQTVKTCRKFQKEGMYIEIDKPRVRNLFQCIEFSLIVPPEEIADRLTALSSQNSGSPLSLEKYEQVKKVSTAHFQKLKKCTALIHELRRNRQSRQTNRRERILIITANHGTARFVRLMLVPNSGSNDNVNINTIVEYDSEEDVENRNFEFRHGTLDVLVIDWKSLQSVYRGTVDSVIMYDPPHPNYFQTIMETQMENLVSRNCVMLKLFIFFHQKDDLILLPNYVKFVEKYNHNNRKTVPQWFIPLYEKFVTNLKERVAERELREVERISMISPYLDATIQ